MPTVSVIIPVYKVERYLDACVESVIGQTYTDLEILLVDDGSPDRCPAMCDAWAEKDPRIRVIHRKNGGLSAARNTGIKAASGAFLILRTVMTGWSRMPSAARWRPSGNMTLTSCCTI